jgi:hypothetical protein
MRKFLVVLFVLAFTGVLWSADKEAPQVIIPKDMADNLKAILTEKVLGVIEDAGDPSKAKFKTGDFTDAKTGKKKTQVLLQKKSEQLSTEVNLGKESGFIAAQKGCEIIATNSWKSGFATKKEVLCVFVPWDKDTKDFGEPIEVTGQKYTAPKGEVYYIYVGTGSGYYVAALPPKEEKKD